MAGPVRAFLSYAHEDHAWRDAVRKHIGWLAHSNQLVAFDDRQLKSGELWDNRIRREVDAADLVIVLISPDFVASRYCSVEELLRAIQKQKEGSADLVPIICDFVMLPTALEPHQCLPQDETNNLKPLRDWPNANKPLMAVATKIRALVDARRVTPSFGEAPKATRPALAALPPRGRFVGRATDLDQLRAWVLDGSRQPIVVLGPGGIGKSKLTLAALHDPAITARFADRRYFVRLHEVRDEAGVYGGLAAALGREPGSQPLADVIAALAGEPALVVLDNAESPWEVDPTDAEQAFARLAELPGTTLVVSLRGFELPGTADWRPILVEPMLLDPARSLFLAIAGDHYAADPALPTMLARLDGLPLAIELVAHRARTEPDAATVLRQWESERGAFLRRGRGGRKDLDLVASIALSLASPRLTDAGRRLFAVLGRLPHGLARADLPAIMPRAGTTAANALAQTGLVLPDPERLRMLAPVREHAAEHTPGEPEATALAAHYAALADTLPCLGESSYDRDAALRARVELPNIEAVLPRRTADPEDSEAGWRWIRVGDMRRTLGSIGLAMTAYEAARACFAASATADPASLIRRRDLSVSWNRIGDVHRAQGDLPGALQAYTADMESTAKLAAADPGNADWQRDLSVSWERIGDVRVAQGDLPGALQAYTESKDIRDRLAAADPGNAEWQRDLSISWNKLGDVRVAQGDLPGALQAFTEGKNIADRLATADPGNAQWQRDLSVSWNNLGDVRVPQGDLPGALQAYTEGKNIRDRLATADPGNAEWQRDLIVSHWKLADLLEQTPDRATDAADHWAQALAIARTLADTGRLAPKDAHFVETLEQRLAAAPPAPDPPP